MQPYEIKPDTKLCTIIGYNAQTGYIRRYFNAILKHQGINATAIGLNLNDDNFDFTMRSLGQSKVDKMLVEQEFAQRVIPFCDELSEDANTRVDCIEVKEGRLYGFNFDKEAEALFTDASLLDDRVRFVAKMMLIANRWFDATVDIDTIPELIQTIEK